MGSVETRVPNDFEVMFEKLKFDYDIEIQCADVGPLTKPQVLLMKGKFAKHN